MNNRIIEPKLRFPEFKENWVKTNFEKLLKYERPDKYIVDNTNYNSEGTPVLTANKAFILGYADENFGIYTKLPVIIFDDFTVDKKYVEFPFKVKSSAIKILKPKFNDNLKFIYELMRTVKFSADEHKRYYISTYQYIDVFVPQKIEEQNKIAECLNSIDELIAGEEDKLKELKNHKKGLLQKLFPKNNSSNPELRFPEFKENWVIDKLSDEKLLIYENGKAHENDIIEKGKYIVVNSKFISSDGKVKKYTDTPNMLAHKDDVLMVLSDVPSGQALAKCYLVEQDNLYTVNQRVCKLTPRKINSIFLYYILNRNPYFLSFDDDIKQTNLKKEEVLNFAMLHPKSNEEQQKIAECISSIDELISAQTEKIEALKLHKKGLMQGLFPSLEEVKDEQ